MPLDEYDEYHKNKYEKIINVYRNDSIEDVINKFFAENSDLNTNFEVKEWCMTQDGENKTLSKNIEKTITKLRNALDILDYRIVTNIGARIFHNVIPDKSSMPTWTYKPQCYLVQVWRAETH
jgi:hypothetical protein